MTEAEPHSHYPPHVDLDRSRVLHRLMADGIAREGAPSWIGAVTNRRYEQSVDWFDDPARSLPGADHTESERLRTHAWQLAENLVMFTEKQDEELTEARTGRLYRVLVQAPGAAAWCLSIGVTDQYIVGLQGLDRRNPAGAATAVLAADDAMVAVAKARRMSLGQSAQDQGGVHADLSAPAEPDPAHHVEHGLVPEDYRGLVDDLRGAVDHPTLHWAGIWTHRSTSRYFIDAFDHPDMLKFSDVMAPIARRAFYEHLASVIHPIMGEAGRATVDVIGRPVHRLIMDVESGVVVVHRLGTQTYLMGVGLYQNRVRAIEERVRRLVEQHLAR